MADEVEIVVRVPRSALVHRPPAPELVTQHNALDVIGLKPRQFLALIRSAPLRVIKTGRTRGVRREELMAYLETLTEGRTEEDRTRPLSLAEQLGLENVDG